MNGDVVFVNTEKPEMSLHIPAKIITSSSLNEGTVTIVASAPIHGLSTFHFKLADPSAAFALSAGTSTGRGGRAAAPTGSIAANSAESPGLMKTFEVRHRHFPRGGCQGRLVVREDKIQFESMTEIGHSELWRMSDIKEIKRKNPYKVELKPFQGSGYDFEVLRQGMSPSDFEFITERVAGMRMSQSL